MKSEANGINGASVTNGVNGHTPKPNEIFVLPFSAASPKSLETRSQQISDLVKQSDSKGLRRLAYTLSRREHGLRLRNFVLATEQPKPALLEADAKTTRGTEPLPFAFVFTGQGAQYAGMARELLEQNDAFYSRIQELDQILQSLPAHQAPSWTLEQTILDPPSTSKVNDVTRSQPLCTAVQIALVDLLTAWGLKPKAVIGHSSGEIVASYSAGLLSASEALLAAYFRGFVVGQMHDQGAMMAAGVSARAAHAMIAEKGLNEVRVACINAPESVTLSGATADIEILQAELQDQKKFARRLETGGRAYHSHMMAAVGDQYENLVAPYFGSNKKRLRKPMQAKMYSTVGYDAEDLGEVDNLTNMASYFRRNLEQPVQFSSALASLISEEKYHIIEIGPHAALQGPIDQIRNSVKRDKDSVPYSSALFRKEDSNICLKKLAGTLFIHGHELDWKVVNNIKKTSLPDQDLPPYPWDYSSGLPWHEPRASVDIRNRKHLRHELLGTRTAADNGIDWSWRNIVRLSEMPWLRDHKLESQVVLPGSAYIAMAIEALSQILDLKGSLIRGKAMSFEGRNISISAPFLPCDEQDAKFEHTELHTTLCQRKISTTDSSADWYEFLVSSWVSGQTIHHCSGSVRLVKMLGAEWERGSAFINGDGYEAWSMGRWYDKSREEGLNFGPHFQSLASLHTDSSRTSADAIATTRLAPPSVKAGESMFYAVHPITIDACFQAAIMGGTAGNLSTLRAYVPVFIGECRITLPNGGASSLGEEDCTIHTRMEKTGFASRRVDCTLRDPSATPVIDMKDVRMSLYTGKAPVEAPSSIYLQRHPCLRIVWKPDIVRMHPGAQSVLRDYIADFAARQAVDLRDDERLMVFGAMLDLASHKTPRMRVLELGEGCQCMSQKCMAMLGKDTAFPHCRSWINGHFDDTGSLSISEDKTSDPFDVILVPSVSSKANSHKLFPCA